jgi:hypothetical protein
MYRPGCKGFTQVSDGDNWPFPVTNRVSLGSETAAFIWFTRMGGGFDRCGRKSPCVYLMVPAPRSDSVAF